MGSIHLNNMAIKEELFHVTTWVALAAREAGKESFTAGQIPARTKIGLFIVKKRRKVLGKLLALFATVILRPLQRVDFLGSLFHPLELIDGFHKSVFVVGQGEAELF